MGFERGNEKREKKRKREKERTENNVVIFTWVCEYETAIMQKREEFFDIFFGKGTSFSQ